MPGVRRASHRVLDRLQQSVINPVVRLAWDLRIPIPGDALLETTGRRTGLPRRTPVCDGLDDDDPQERWRILARANPARRFRICTAKALNTSPLTVRIDLDIP
jgi:F420H(2)-dependent quinone reductase